MSISLCGYFSSFADIRNQFVSMALKRSSTVIALLATTIAEIQIFAVIRCCFWLSVKLAVRAAAIS